MCNFIDVYTLAKRSICTLSMLTLKFLDYESGAWSKLLYFWEFEKAVTEFNEKSLALQPFRPFNKTTLSH